MSHSFQNLYYHVIWSTRKRVPMITETLEPILYQHIKGVVDRNNGSLIGIGGTENHIHLLIRLSSNVAVAKVIQNIKANSSRFINEYKNLDYWFYWQEGYSAFTVSPSLVKRVEKYIENQKEHHRDKSFEEELSDILEKANFKFESQH